MWRCTTTSTQSGTGAWTAATPSTGTPTQMFWRWARLLRETQGLPPNSCTAATVGLHPAVLPDGLSAIHHPLLAHSALHADAWQLLLPCSAPQLSQVKGCLPSCK